MGRKTIGGTAKRPFFNSRGGPVGSSFTLIISVLLPNSNRSPTALSVRIEHEWIDLHRRAGLHTDWGGGGHIGR